MSKKIENLISVKAQLESVSPSFCLAKWMQVTLHLHSGFNHSCHHPGAHQTPLTELKKDPSALHNTEFKKKRREEMKTGVRPKECQYCWNIEDLGSHLHSDRIMKSSEGWAWPEFERIKSLSPDVNVNPTYVEVSFSNACQFKCSYCSANFSTRWADEIRQHGSYPTGNGELSMNILNEDENPYIKAFWEWWPNLVQTLKIFRITGGEPLLSPNTFRVIESLTSEPRPQLDFMINSNLGVSEPSFQKFLSNSKHLVDHQKIKSLTLFTSVDAWGERAEYIRNGLNFSTLTKRIEAFLESVPQARLVIMVTFNALSPTSFLEFAKYVLSLKNKYCSKGNNRLSMDLSYLRHPTHQSVLILPKEYTHYIENLFQFLKENELTEQNHIGFTDYEILKCQRLLELFKEGLPEANLMKCQRDFYRFFSEHDKRRQTDFLKTFPEMEEFWHHCKSLQ